MMRPEFLDMSKILYDKHIVWLFRAVEDHGGTLRFVGGTVRDALAHFSGFGFDLATDLSPDELVEACEDSGLKTVPIGLKLDTIGVILNNQILQISCLRKNIISETGEQIVTFSDDWNVDASKRDLTINAVYADLKGNVFDYYNGIDDLEKGIVRFIGNAEDRIKEDYLRILRFFRFYAIFGKGEPDTDSLCACIKFKDGLRAVAIERVRDEFFKILTAKNAYKALKLIFDNDILGFFLPQPKNIKAFKKLSEIVDEAKIEPSFLRRLFVLYQPNAAKAESIANTLRLTKKQKETFANWAKIEVTQNNIMTKEMRLKFIYRYGKQFCIDKILLTCALYDFHPQQLNVVLQEVENAIVPIFPIRGRDVINFGITPNGQNIGKILEQLERQWIDCDFSLTREELLNEIKILQ